MTKPHKARSRSGKKTGSPGIRAVRRTSQRDEIPPKTPIKTRERIPVDEEESMVKCTDSLKAYMRNIGGTALLTREQEGDLACAVRGSDREAADGAIETLVTSNLRLVVKISHDFKGYGLPLQDLVSEGNIGLMRAAQKFDPRKGAKFSSYAAWWIKQSMRRAIANQGRTIRIPVQSASKMAKIRLVRMKLNVELGREATNSEVAEKLALSERTVTGLQFAELRTFSLQDPIQQGEEGELQDIIPDANGTNPGRIVADLESLERLKCVLDSLDARERAILVLRFGLNGARPKTLDQVSRKIRRTRERVRQIQNQALRKLRTVLADESEFNVE